jgi:hypothetical protein
MAPMRVAIVKWTLSECAGGVDQDVHSAEALYCLGHGSLHRIDVARIGADRQRLEPVRRSLVISDPPRHDRSPCLSEFSPGLAIEEHHILLDGRAANVQLIGGEVWVGVADRQAAQNRQFRRDSQLCADDLGIPRD